MKDSPPSNIERILRVVRGLNNLDDKELSSFLYFFLGTLMAIVRQHPGQVADDLVNDLDCCAAMFGITGTGLNSDAIKKWLESLEEISSAPAGVSKPSPPDAGASGNHQCERK